MAETNVNHGKAKYKAITGRLSDDFGVADIELSIYVTLN